MNDRLHYDGFGARLVPPRQIERRRPGVFYPNSTTVDTRGMALLLQRYA